MAVETVEAPVESLTPSSLTTQPSAIDDFGRIISGYIQPGYDNFRRYAKQQREDDAANERRHREWQQRHSLRQGS